MSGVAAKHILTCRWCDRAFRARQSGGRPQLFCRLSCRRSFHATARAWAIDAIAYGALTVVDIRGGSSPTRALLTKVDGTARDHWRGPTALSLRILPNAISDLQRLGWLNRADRATKSAVADAVVELAERAIALGLRPA